MKLPAFLEKLRPKKGASKAKRVLNKTAVMLFLSIVIAGFDVWTIQGIVRTVYQYKFSDIGARQVISTRVDFGKYDTVLQKKKKGEVYEPERPVGRNPFMPVGRAGEE